MPILCDPWPLDPGCLPADFPADPAAWTPAQRQAVETASEILKRLTAGVFGLCTIKIRPCRRRCEENTLRYGQNMVAGPWQPALIDGRMYNLTCGCAGECGCSPLCEILLNPDAYDILEVKIDGVVLPATAYRVDDNRRLVRTDGACWPDCQELARPDSAPGTFSITYRTGNAVPPGGRMAVTDLAVQLWKACRGGKGCTLPERVTQVVREGITYTLLDQLDVFERGRTGLNRVDLWLSAVNPHATRAPMRAYSPDTIRSRRTTWPTETLPGPPTPPAGGTYVHTQSVASDVWTIVHNLGFPPGGVQIVDSAGQEVQGEVEYPIPNTTVLIRFNGPVSGIAYLS